MHVKEQSPLHTLLELHLGIRPPNSRYTPSVSNPPNSQYLGLRPPNCRYTSSASHILLITSMHRKYCCGRSSYSGIHPVIRPPIGGKRHRYLDVRPPNSRYTPSLSNPPTNQYAS
ncbi:hypothetical protein CDAR_91681 [Caerostris darwini]|uniref:Uncharacterized protein n=1 Tax=Caerostris darwini TaxID=1538125 RepID=A0AAV4QR00_9ARAC|nr:hypothetical protein CDAR_91681 [Caerostris darwini]